jgi:hypothetical protein
MDKKLAPEVLRLGATHGRSPVPISSRRQGEHSELNRRQAWHCVELIYGALIPRCSNKKA